MRILTFLTLVFVCFAATHLSYAQSITLQSETSNDTSACSADGTPSYCNASIGTLNTSSANQGAGAETTTVDAIPGHVSSVQIGKLMNTTSQNWTGKVLCEYQPWFYNEPPYNNHIDIGYNENNQSTVTAQDSDMISRGCNINFIDFYGDTDSNQKFNLTSTNYVYSDLKSRSGFPMQIGILEDENAFSGECTNDNQTHDAVVSCIESSLETDMSYIYTTYISPPNTTGLYWTDSITGHAVNVIGFFGACGDFAVNNIQILNCPTDWDNIWSTVSGFANSSPQNYNMEFIFEYGEFGAPPISAGVYAWPQPYTTAACKTAKTCFTSDPPSQFDWCDGNLLKCDGNYESGAYLDRFYHDASQNLNQIAVGLLDKGFDDSNASWTADRVVAQQCGQVQLDTANEVSAGGFWGSNGHQIPYMQVATWNDYEEATEQESGINNCYTISSVFINSEEGTLNWTLHASDSTYASLNTIDHFTIWWSLTSSNNITVAATNIANNQNSIDLSQLSLPVPAPSGDNTVDLYVEMVGKPSILNQMPTTRVPYTY
jgi:hypothetical protein